jgi:hypothetical protein
VVEVGLFLGLSDSFGREGGVELLSLPAASSYVSQVVLGRACLALPKRKGMRALRLNGLGSGALEAQEMLPLLLCICLFVDLNYNRSVKRQSNGIGSGEAIFSDFYKTHCHSQLKKI